MSPTVSLAIEVGGLTADTRVALCGDLVNVLIDASHACDFVMIDDFCEVHWTSACIYSPYRKDCPWSSCSSFNPVVNVRNSIGEAARVDPLAS